MSSQPYVKETPCIGQVTNKIPNSPAQECVRHQVPSLSSLSIIRAWCALALLRLVVLVSGGRISISTALPPPSSLTRPGSSILLDLIDPSAEGVYISIFKNHGRRWICKKRMFFAQHPATTADWLDVM
jgi:hypothetical protein